MRKMMYVFACLMLLASGNAGMAKQKKSAPNVVWDQNTLSLRSGENVYRMIPVKSQEFYLGATGKLRSGSDYLEYPTPKVTIGSYLLGETEVPQWLWVAVMGSNPSSWKDGDNMPVESVSYLMCRDFIDKLSDITGIAFRLPNEVEWELAAREGRSDCEYIYSGGDDLDEVAWYKYNSDERPHPIMTKKPNKLGFYDLTGNVSEWCSNALWRYSYGTIIDPPIYDLAPPLYPVIRGGGYHALPQYCRLSNRMTKNNNQCSPALGLRLAI